MANLSFASPRRRPPRLVTPDVVAVAPELVGRRLASPIRRLAAATIDGACVSLLGGLGFAALAGVACFATLRAARRHPSQMRRRQLVVVAAVLAVLAVGSLWKARSGKPPVRVMVNGNDVGVTPTEVLASLPEILALEQAKSDAEADATAQRLVERLRASSKDPAALEGALREIMDDQDNPRVRTALERAMAATPAGVPGPAVAAVREYADALSSGDVVRAGTLRPAVAESVAAPELRAERAESLHLRRLNEGLSSDLEEARKPPLRRVLFGVADDLGLSIGWGMLYFTALTAIWSGQTIGKRLLRIRVVRLDGKPIGWWVAFNRVGGYAASAFTGMLGFAEMIWDEHRQALHDKIAWTVVLREGDVTPPPLPAISRP